MPFGFGFGYPLPNRYGTSSSAAPTLAGSLPSGLVGLWPMDTYETSPKPAVPNMVNAATARSANLITATRRAFVATGLGSLDMWGRTNVTVVDSAAVGPDGLTEASTVVSTGANDWYVDHTVTLPAGTYTLSVYIKSNDGNAQSIRLGRLGSEATKAVTTSWARITTTFTVTAGAIQCVACRGIDGATAGSVQICDATLHAGSSDLGPDVLAGHCYFGINAYAETTSVSGGIYIGAFSTRRALAQFPTASFSAVTMIAVMRCARSVGLGYPLGLTNAQIALFGENGGIADANFHGSSLIFNTAIRRLYPNLWKYLGAGWTVRGASYDGVTGRFWVDDILFAQTPLTLAATSAADWFIDAFSDDDVAIVGLWNRALSASEYRTAVTTLKARAALSSITTITERILICEGDSIMVAGTTNGGFPKLAAANLSPICHGYNGAISGSTLNVTMAARAAVVNAIVPPSPGARKFILAIEIGHNDQVGGRTTAQFLADYASYYTAAKAAGWTDVVACTVTPTTVAGGNTWRNVVNPALVGGIGVYCDHVVNFDLVSGMGADGDASNATNYSDGTHPTDAGNVLLEPAFTAVINAI